MWGITVERHRLWCVADSLRSISSPKGSLGGGELDLGMCTILSPIVPPPLCFNFISCMASSSCCWFDGSKGKRGIPDLFIPRQTINPWDQLRSCSSSSSFFFSLSLSLLDPPSNNWSELANLTWSSFYFFVCLFVCLFFFCFLVPFVHWSRRSSVSFKSLFLLTPFQLVTRLCSGF